MLETDASGTSLGEVLSQNGHPIAFFSKKLAPRAQKQSAYVRELMAITVALAKFRHYLLGHPFVLRTDWKSLKNLLDQSLQTPEQQSWLHKFLGFDFRIEYKPGKDNIAANALSRVLFMAWSEPRSKFLQEFQKEIETNEQAAAILRAYLDNAPMDPHFTVKDGLLYWKGRLFLPKGIPLIQQVLFEYHTSPIGGQ